MLARAPQPLFANSDALGREEPWNSHGVRGVSQDVGQSPSGSTESYGTDEGAVMACPGDERKPQERPMRDRAMRDKGTHTHAPSVKGNLDPIWNGAGEERHPGRHHLRQAGKTSACRGEEGRPDAGPTMPLARHGRTRHRHNTQEDG